MNEPIDRYRLKFPKQPPCRTSAYTWYDVFGLSGGNDAAYEVSYGSAETAGLGNGDGSAAGASVGAVSAGVAVPVESAMGTGPEPVAP